MLDYIGVKSATSFTQPGLERFCGAGCDRLNKSIITKNATIKAKTTFCSSPPQFGLSPVGDLASAVENAWAAYSGTIAAPHEYFDHTGRLRWLSCMCSITRRVARDLVTGQPSLVS